jgi:hypothetical protein
VADQRTEPNRPIIPRPALALPALREAVAIVAPARLPEFFDAMQNAFVNAGEDNSVIPIHMFYREWAIVVEIERFPRIAKRLHAAERALDSDDPQVRAQAIRETGQIVREAHHEVTGG